MANELLQALADLAPAQPVRWPDGPDLRAEVIANALLASPVATRQYVEVLGACLDRVEALDDLAAELYQAGAWFGGHGGGEVAGLLWQLADAIADSLNQKGADRA
jgi:hypothetical protein